MSVDQDKTILKLSEEQLYQAALLMGDPQAIAYKEIVNYVHILKRNLSGIPVKRLRLEHPLQVIELAYNTINHNLELWSKYAYYGGFIEDHYLSSDFWKNVAIYKEVELPLYSPLTTIYRSYPKDINDV